MAAEILVVNLKIGHGAATPGIANRRGVAHDCGVGRTARPQAADVAVLVGRSSRRFLGEVVQKRSSFFARKEAAAKTRSQKARKKRLAMGRRT